MALNRFRLARMWRIAAGVARRWRFAARRLNAAERAAKLINLALVGELLALGDLNEFENLIELVNHLLERLGNLRGMGDGFADGRGFGGTEIGGLDPRLRAHRFRAAFRTPLAGKFALRFGLRCRRNFSGGFRHRLFHRLGFVRGKIGGRFDVRFAKIAGGIGLVMIRMFGSFTRRCRWFNRFRCGRNFFGTGRAGLGHYRTRAAATTATATATAIAAWAGCGCGRFQIGMFVRHKF